MVLTLTGTDQQLGMSSLAMMREMSEQGLADKSITFQLPFDQMATLNPFVCAVNAYVL